MTQLKETIQWSYRGREVQRADGKQRRIAILDATLKIISRTGVRGVRHRAVAEEAGVPLSATTYYFKDIEDLIFDAFIYFVERNHKSNLALEQQCLAALDKYSAAGGAKRSQLKAKQAFAEDIAEAVIIHIGKQVKNKKNRKIEWAYKVEAIRNNQMAKFITLAENILIEKIEFFFQTLKIKQPDYQASLFMGTILHFEYKLLLQSQPHKKLAELKPQIHMAITQLILQESFGNARRG